MTRPLLVGAALFLVGAMCLAVYTYERGGGCQWSPRQRTRFVRDGALRGRERVVRVSRSCLSSLADLLGSPRDWYVPKSDHGGHMVGVMVFPHSGSVLGRLGVRPRDVISAIRGVALDSGEQLLVAASTLKANPSAPFEIRVSCADGATLRAVVESATSSCESFGGRRCIERIRNSRRLHCAAAS